MKCTSTVRIICLFVGILSVSETVFSQHSVARKWNDVLLQAIREDFARPTVHARNLFHSSVLLYDAWAAYESDAQTYFLGDSLGDFYCPFDSLALPADIQAAQEEAMSYAAYRLLRHRFQHSPNDSTSLARFDSLFLALGYDPTIVSTNYQSDSAASLGNYLAAQMIAFGLTDGANEQNDYGNTFYGQSNPVLLPTQPGNPSLIDPNRWQPLTLDVYIDQSGNEIPINTPPFLSPEWGHVVPFALIADDSILYHRQGNPYPVYLDPGHPPYIDTLTGAGTTDAYQWGFALVSVWSSHLDPNDGVMWDISPASIGNIQSYPDSISDYPAFYDLINGGDAGVGHPLNPTTGLHYQQQIVPRGDYARVLAEFWADGPESETPPGHWYTILNYVHDHPQFERRWKGEGPLIDPLEWDVKAYLTLGGAVHDAAIVAWSVKGWYDYIRPVSALRYMMDQGQSSDTSLANYSVKGIPLIPGKIEVVEASDSLAMADSAAIGKIKVLAWQGPDSIADPTTDVAGVDWILGENWWPYQRPTFVTPPFAGYVSGHSTFSRAAAEILTAITGDAFFPGGMGSFHAAKDSFLVFERGPSMDITLQWATYRDASDQCSLSRIWGSIHPPADDIPGRLMGIEIGVNAYEHANTYFDPNGKPDVLSVSSNLMQIHDPDSGLAKLHILIEYEEDMDSSMIPTILFPTDNPLIHTLIFNEDSSSWVNPYTFEAKYDIVNSDELLDSISLRVESAQNKSGVVQAVYEAAEFLFIDTENPILLDILSSTDTIGLDDIGHHGFSLRFVFDEEMDTAVHPLITFPQANPLEHTLSLNADSSGWMDRFVYVASYDVAPTPDTLIEIDISVQAGQNLVGNIQDPLLEGNLFHILIQDTSTVTVGTDLEMQSGALLVYPNPVQAGISPQIQLPMIEGEILVELLDIHGQPVWSRMIRDSMSGREIELDVSELASGVYVIRIQGKDAAEHCLMIVQE